MRIGDILKDKQSLSFEVFPPKLDQPLEPLVETLDVLEKCKPDFFSVTYGAGGTNNGRNNEICSNILDRGCNLISHFTCIGNSKEDIEKGIREFQDMGAENILALRGDLPEGWTGTGGYYKHGNDLIAAIHEIAPEICIGGACYPEKHIEAPDMETDIKWMKSKQDNGVEYFITQLCFDLEAFDRFRDVCDKNGITAPIVVGIMPVIFKNGLLRMTKQNGCNIPKDLMDIVDKYGDVPADFKKAGLEYTYKLVEEYKNREVSGLHLYTLNKSETVVKIIKELGLR